MRILIVLPGALGDVVRALPLLGRLRRAHPGATIGWVVEPLSAPLLADHPWLDRCHRFERRRGLAGLVAVAREVRAAGYDVALDCGRGAKSAAIVLASGARRRIGFARADAREGSWLVATEQLAPQGVARSKLEQFLAFGERLGAADGAIEFGVRPSDRARARAAEQLDGAAEPLVVACLGSSCPARRWWPARTAAVLDVLRARVGGTGVLVGTPADAGFAAAVRRHAAGPIVDLTGRTGIDDLVAVLARARVAFGPDSGALHLAAALGAPVVSLWGATSAARSAPFGSEALVLEGAAPCRPCFLTRCPMGRPCMAGITVDAVAERAARALAA